MITLQVRFHRSEILFGENRFLKSVRRGRLQIVTGTGVGSRIRSPRVESVKWRGKSVTTVTLL